MNLNRTILPTPFLKVTRMMSLPSSRRVLPLVDQRTRIGKATGVIKMVVVAVTLALLSAATPAATITSGETVSGSINLAGQSDEWTFTANAGDSIVLRSGEVTETGGTQGFTPGLRLYGPSGGQLDVATGSLNALEVTAQATEPGLFRVVVSDGGSYDDGTGTYRLHLAKSPGTLTVSSGDEGGAFTNGIRHEGTIHLGDLDMWNFTANAGDNIVVRAGAVTETGGTQGFTPGLRLYGPDGTLLDRSVVGFSAVEVSASATEGGIFTVVVADGGSYIDGTGTYQVHLARSAATFVISPTDEGGAMTNGATHAGTIETGDLDVWGFMANSGDRIVVRAGEVTELGGTQGFTPALRLYDPDGALLDSAAAGFNAVEVTATATNSGTFTVVVADGGSYIDGSGTYQVHLARSAASFIVSPGDEGGALTNGATHQGTIDTGELDVWSFMATEGDRIVVRAGEVTELAGTQGFTPALRLYDPDGALLDSVAAGFNAVEVTATATNSGMFTVVVADGGSYIDGSGTYQVHLARSAAPFVVSPGDEGGALTNGATHQGTIDTGELDVWSFMANAGDRIVVRAGEVTDLGGTQGFTPALRLYDPDGALLDSAAAGFNAVEVTVTATNSGMFMVVVADGGSYIDGLGTYRLHLGKAPGMVVVSPGDEGGSLLNGATHEATIDVGDLDVWSFSASVGDNLLVRAGELVDMGGTQGFTPALRLYGPTGVLQDSSDFGRDVVEVAVTATNAGIFTVIVADGGSYLDGLGTYRLHLVNASTPFVVSAGDEGGPMTNAVPFGGSIHAGDLDAWSFAACRGSILSLQLDELTGDTAFVPRIRLYGPDGVLLDSVSDQTSVIIDDVAPQGGTYLLVVSDGNSIPTGTGTYQLTAAGIASGLTLCPPEIAGTNVFLSSVGGEPGGNYVLLTTTNVSTPVLLWRPVGTNQFNSYGEFNYTNYFDADARKTFFLLRRQ